MRVLFDQGTPVPLRYALASHAVSTAYEMGWADFKNGDLIVEAERAFDALITTDRNLRHQQNLAGLRLGIVVLPTTSWSRIRRHTSVVVDALATLRPGEYVELSMPG